MTKAVTDERLAELVQGHEAVPDWSQLKQFSAEILGCLRELQELRSALTARDEALACIRVFAQDCIENGHFDRGALGNLYSIRDLCDSKGENLK